MCCKCNSEKGAGAYIVAQADAAVVEEAREDVDALEHVVHGLGDFVVAREPGPLTFHPMQLWRAHPCPGCRATGPNAGRDCCSDAKATDSGQPGPLLEDSYMRNIIV